jgi:hypothetical protein
VAQGFLSVAGRGVQLAMGGGIKGGLKGGVTKVTGLTKLSHSHTTPFGTWRMGNAMGGGE